jgi:hypothetical protein
MNTGKRRHPFLYPDLFIQWMACVHLFLQMTSRQMEGYTWQLSSFIPLKLYSTTATATYYHLIPEEILHPSIQRNISSS